MTEPFVRAPASSANLGAGFDVLGMAVDLYADFGFGDAPPDAQQIDRHHPGRQVFEGLGGVGELWMRCNIPMARGLGFSGAARVGASALAVVQQADGDGGAIDAHADRILAATATMEGHGDNVAASLFGGVTAYVGQRVVRLRVGPVLSAARFIAWVPEVTTSTDASRRLLGSTVDRSAAIHNIGHAIQLVAAVEHDDPELLIGAASDQMHQDVRLPTIERAAEALGNGVEAGAWAGWLSGSGPTVGLLCEAGAADAVVASLPPNGHAKVLSIDTLGTRLVSDD